MFRNVRYAEFRTFREAGRAQSAAGIDRAATLSSNGGVAS